MRIIVTLFLVALIFVPTTAFGMKSLAPLYEKECTVNCFESTASIDSSKPMNFILLAAGSLIGLGIFIKMNRLGKFETFSFKCEHCGRSTRGLKCVMCESRKPKQI